MVGFALTFFDRTQRGEGASRLVPRELPQCPLAALTACCLAHGSAVAILDSACRVPTGESVNLAACLNGRRVQASDRT